MHYIIKQAIKIMHMLINSLFPIFSTHLGWRKLCSNIETAKQVIKIKIKKVLWKKPDSGWHKLNTDACSIGNPGSAGGGGIIRNSDGSFKLAYT